MCQTQEECRDHLFFFCVFQTKIFHNYSDKICIDNRHLLSLAKIKDILQKYSTHKRSPSNILQLIIADVRACFSFITFVNASNVEITLIENSNISQ